MIKTAQFRSIRNQGFTLVELLVVIAIIAVLAAVVVLVVNPVELTKRSRDAVRLSDLASLQQAINVVVQDSTLTPLQTYCTPPADTGTLPCTGVTTDSGGREINGSGWVKVDLSGQTTINIPTLPIDPSNGATYKYTYFGNSTGYKLEATLESQQQSSKMVNDGGDNNSVYEVGTDLSL